MAYSEESEFSQPACLAEADTGATTKTPGWLGSRYTWRMGLLDVMLLGEVVWPSPPVGTSWWFYVACVAGAVVVVGIAKAGFGGGIGVLAVPLTAAALPPERAIGVLLPILIVADVFSVYHHRRSQSWRHLRWLWMGMVVGVAVGTGVLWWFANLEPAAVAAEAGAATGVDVAARAREVASSPLAVALNLTVGLLCLAFVLLQAYRLAGGHVPHIPEGPAGGAGSGAFAAAVSTIAHAAGPVISIYLLEQRMPKAKLVGTMILFFFVLNLSKLPSYFALGLITQATLTESLCFVAFVPVGTLAGVWMHHRIPEKPFTAVMYIGAALAAMNMLYKAWPSVAGWFGG